MLAAIIASVLTMVLTAVSCRIYYTQKHTASIDKHNELVKPIADTAFLEGFDKGWHDALADPMVVKNAYIRHWMKEY